MQKRNNRMLFAALVWVSSAVGGACNCQTRLAVNGDTTVKITAPNDGDSFLVSDTVGSVASADNAAGLTSLALMVGSQQLVLCNASPAGATHIDCTGSFVPMDYANQIVNGQLVITAAAVSGAGISASASIMILITEPVVDAGQPPVDAGQPPVDAGPAVWSLVFLQPMPSNGFPPTASVTGTSALQMGIVGTPSTPVTSIAVVDEHNNSIANFTTAPYQSTIDWQTVLGVGAHTLTGTATDRAGEKEMATLVLTVVSSACTSDAACFTGQRCCLDDGLCHPVVAENADCDCAHPCPTDEGCFPGTCGKLPQQCRQGCFPGSDPTLTNPNGKAADACPPINGVQAYCAPLPPSQVTTANKGGACAPGDGCDVALQNCPDAPLNPGSDAGVDAGNPIVPYTCEPAGMNGNNEATVCFPAGTHPPQSNASTSNTCEGENSTCGSQTAGCTKGYECDGIEGDPGAGQACSQQCSEPYAGEAFCPPAGGCPSGTYCTALFGDGMVLFSTGVCAPLGPGCN